MPYEYRRRGRFGEIMGNLAVAVFFGALIFACMAFAVQSTNEARAAAYQQANREPMMHNIDVRTLVIPTQTVGGFAAPQRREASSCAYEVGAPCPYCGRGGY